MWSSQLKWSWSFCKKNKYTVIKMQNHYSIKPYILQSGGEPALSKDHWQVYSGPTTGLCKEYLKACNQQPIMVKIEF